MRPCSSRPFRALIAVVTALGSTLATVAATGSVAAASPFTYTQVSTGYHAACAVTTDGTGVCWGWNNQKSLGTADTSEKVATPSRVSLPNGERFASIDAGQYFTTCGVSTTGNAYCWGQHHIGSYFTPTSTTPVRVELPSGTRVTKITNGSAIACAVTTTKELWCWGDVAEFGNGSTEATRTPERVPMPDGSTVESVDAGPDNTCAITTAQHLYCWGSNDDGEIGLGYISTRVSLPTSPQLPAGVTPRSVSVGLNRICALDTTGTGWCWGDNYDGSLGNDSYVDSSRPVRVLTPGDAPLSELGTAWYHTCGTLTEGTTYCWGRGGFGELGTGTTLGGKTFRTPVVPAGVTFTTVATGLATSCAIDNSGRIWCWTGSNWGVAGTGDLTMSLFPRLIAPIGSPTVDTPSVPDVAAETATVRAVVNPNGSATSVIAEVSTESTFRNPVRVAAASTISAGLYSPSTVSIALDNLTPRASHWVRIIATNQWGSVTSTATEFLTIGSEPSVSLPSVADISATRADVNVTVDPGLLATSGRLEVSRNEDFTEALTLVLSPVSPTGGSQSRSASVRGLSPRTTYWVRAVFVNRLGSTTSSPASFATVGAPPLVTDTDAVSTVSSVTVTARVNGGMLPGTVHAELVADQPGSNPQTSVVQSFPEGTDPQVSFTFASLPARTDFRVRVIATNTLGTSASGFVPVRTRGTVAVISGISAGSITATSATVSASIDATGLPTMTKLQIATDPRFTTGLDEHFVGLLSNDGAVVKSINFINLERRTTYYARFVGTNAAGTAESDTVSFTTLTPVGIEINNDDDTTTDTAVTVNVSFPAGAVGLRMADNPAMRYARVLGRVNTVAWNLTPSTDPESERTIYVQFLFESGAQSAVYSDSITLLAPDSAEPADDTAPEVTTASVLKVAAAAVRSSASGFRVKVSGTDAFSGIRSIQVRGGGKTISTVVAPTRRLSTVVVSPSRSGLWVRLVDAAGNTSKWKKVRSG